ncbi:two component transcriptional regulator, LuxR family [Rhizobiales bacterium GAS113]|nr:two component transcriptional regulator, LuxR family [Rhizobiales bacterium GAS113]
MTGEANTIFVVDDEPAILKALERLLRGAGFEVRGFLSSQAFLEQHDPAIPGCAVLDVAMDGMNGLELQQKLAASGCERPVVFLSGRGDIPMSVRAMRAGAVSFLTKPVRAEDLLAAIRRAIEKDDTARRAHRELDAIGRRLATLTPRETEVLRRVIAGRLNKQIAGELGTAEKTIKVHRARVMEKMGVRSVAELVRMTDQAGFMPADMRSGADPDSPDWMGLRSIYDLRHGRRN